MDGVILFADDDIFNSQKFENKLFQKFNLDGNFSILPIDNLTILEKTISSISTFKALILDWNFKRVADSDIEEAHLPDDSPFEFLKKNKIYSLVYIYSKADIGVSTKEKLEELYPSKIFFEVKNPLSNPDEEYTKILTRISKFEEDNKHLVVPFVWSQAINQSSQNIFTELESADPNWIKEIYDNAVSDGTEPNNEVIGIFQNLLNESIIQNHCLLSSLNKFTSEQYLTEVAKDSESLAKLYNRIYYTKLINDAPLMTGDIFKFDDDEFAILITPECDVHKKKDSALEFLSFSKSQSKTYITKRITKDGESIFNNKFQSNHVLPSFPFENSIYNLTAYINFEVAYKVINKLDYDNKRSSYKLNAPYIFQLRQRYISYLGKVGVPAIPKSLREFNLK